ncbi:hypothetical protein [Guptibacillus hwajinpoensis]|uniref:hypothetical protein n=1 Tax=Guptibacillus hwajinpoensis TaxID=208199 RepID=UPI00137928AA|nr:hypothetical protein [Alkalihalobacillus macyae]
MSIQNSLDEFLKDMSIEEKNSFIAEVYTCVDNGGDFDTIKEICKRRITNEFGR